MEIENWSGRIICDKKRSMNINFRVEPELFKKLEKIENKSELIREAIKEKLRNISDSYLISEKEKFIYQ